MKAALLLVLSLAALAHAGPFNKNTNNQIEANKAYQQQQHQQHMTSGDVKQTQAVQALQQWCFSSQMSQSEMTASFKKLIGIVKASPEDQSTEAAVMSERICQGALVQKSAQSGETIASDRADAQAHELIKDVYMDALIACESRECMRQLIKIINSNKVDTIRASYYMTRIAVTEKDAINKDDSEAKQLAESFLNSSPSQQTSEAIERQKLFAVTAMLGKSLEKKPESSELKQIAEQVAKTILERYVKPVSQQEAQQYQQQQPEQQSSQVAKKIAKRSAALKALANIPSSVLSEIKEVEQIMQALAQNKDELNTVRQSAIECLEQNDSAYKQLKQITYDQQEPIEVRVAAYRAMMTVAYAGSKDEQSKQQMAQEIVGQVVKHCEDQSNQQNDDQFVLYAVSHLDNLRTSQQPEHQAIKESIAKNKQHYMQIQLLNKKFKQQLQDVRKSSRNYKLEQEFNQIESGLIIEGDLIYESKHNKQQQKQYPQILPKLIRVNMSMPVMGETVNVVEITVRQNQMDEEFLSALKLAKNAKFDSESVSKVVDSFKSSVEQQQQRAASTGNKQEQNAEADLSIKVDGCNIMYLCVDDFKSSSSAQQGHQRNTRSIYSSNNIVDEIIEHLKRQPVAFNRGFNFNFNERLGKVLDVDANIIAGLRFESRAQGSSSQDYEIVAQVEPRFAFEAIVGPAKVSSKKLLQRVSTKTALGIALRYKSNELVDVKVDLPMNTMELFTVEAQMVEKSTSTPYSYSYLPESIYGREDIYSSDEEYSRAGQQLLDDGEYASSSVYSPLKGIRKMKRSIFEKKSTGVKSIVKFMQGKTSTFAHSLETPEDVARATGLRGKLRVVASPKDMSFLAQAIVQKYDQKMQGYRVQVQKAQRGAEQMQYTLTVSTPGSRVDRSMQVRVAKQSNSQRTMIKSEIQSPKMNANAQFELIHDGRQYAVKAEIASSRGSQWRHHFETGVLSGSQSQSGRIATTYKPYVTVESTSMKRPVQMQGVVSYQQSPKTVISYELKSPTSSDFVQGKIMLDSRTNQASYSKRSQGGIRSMRSPIEQLIQGSDLTYTAELVAQMAEHAVKVHQMIDWDSAKTSVAADFAVAHKNLRKSTDSQWTSSLKLNEEQQMFNAQYKEPKEPRNEFRLTVASDTKSPMAHQFVAEYRYNGKRASNLESTVAYKHKIDYSQLSSSKLDLGYTVEITASEYQVNEKVTGRTQVTNERKMKALQTEMSSRDKSAKLNFEFASIEQHQFELAFQSQSAGSHRTAVVATPRSYSFQSRTTDKQGQTKAKISLEMSKPQAEAQLIVEVPKQNTHIVADVKLAPGKLSSIAVQTPRFASKAEFSFETMTRSFSNKHIPSIWKRQFPLSQLRFKTDLKDTMNKQAYWLDSDFSNNADSKSYFRFDSPIYRTDLEFDPSEQNTKWGLFARQQPSSSSYNQLYSSADSLLSQALSSKNLGNKLWMLRSVVSSPSQAKKLKEQARRALFEYADRRQQHKHSFEYNPTNERLNFNSEYQPSTGASWQPMRFTADLGTNWSSQQQQRPSSLNLESEWVDFDMKAKPFDGEECYTTLTALSRHRRSPFKKHESEMRYKKSDGYKAWMKHQDSKDKRHSWQLEADKSPKKYAKMSYDSDKHGKASYEHQWRKQLTKRSHNNEDIYANKIAFDRQTPNNDWSHRTQLQWDEPAAQNWGRVRRDLSSERYNAIDYLKHVNARLNSQTSKDQAQLYNLDFDYKPESYARFNMDMPNDMFHSSSYEFEPTERLYKLQSKLTNRRTNQPSYELSAYTKQQPSFYANDDEDQMSGQYASLFKQPLKFDYTDKYGRAARFDYDLSPATGSDKYTGLRQKRAALYYKDDSNDFEHQSSYDFYPEAMFRGRNSPSDIVLKAQTKYGPVAFKAESNDKTIELQLDSPVANAKLTGETSSSKRGTQLIKLSLDNKHQNVQLAKIVRNSILNKCEFAEMLAHTIDQSRIEHQTELLVSVVDAIFKVKSQTKMNQTPVMTVEGELNKQQEKVVVKINGSRTGGYLTVDLATKSANLALDVDNKRTVQHQTRLVRLDNKFFALDSTTSYKQKPLVKLSGKISSMIFSEPQHLFSRRRSGSSSEEHISAFEAVIYEPKQMQVTGQYDCLKKEARVIYKDVDNKQVSDVRLRYDDQAENLQVDARTSSPRGVKYQIQKTLNVTPFVSVY